MIEFIRLDFIFKMMIDETQSLGHMGYGLKKDSCMKEVTVRTEETVLGVTSITQVGADME